MSQHQNQKNDKKSDYKSSVQQSESQNSKTIYSKKKSLRHVIFSQYIKELIDVLSFFVLVATLFVSVLTIFEMKKDRNENYKPMIAGNPFTEIMATSDYPNSVDKNEIYLQPSAYVTFSDSSIVAEGYKTIALPDYEEGTYRTYGQFDLANIGSGMATNVIISWDDNNLQALYETLKKSSEIAADSFNFDNYRYGYITLYWDGSPWDSMNGIGDCDLPFPGKTEFSYMLPEGKEFYTVEFPILYSVLISEILLYDENAEPAVKMNVEFTDTQGIEYYETLILKVSKRSMLILDNSWEDGTILSKFGGIHEIKYDDGEEYEAYGHTYKEYYKCYGITYKISFASETPDVKH